MSALITISSSWHDQVWLFEKLALASTGDSILLLQDAVLATHSSLTLASFAAKCKAMNVALYVLSEDVELRGISNKYPDIAEVNYAGFVRLVAQHHKQVAW